MALGTGSWTIAGIRATGTSNKLHESMVYEGKKKIINVKAVLASGNVAGGGVTLPGPGAFGLVRNVDAVILQGPHDLGSSGVYFDIKVSGNLDTTRNFKLVAYQATTATGTGKNVFTSGSALATSATIASKTFYLRVEGW